MSTLNRLDNLVQARESLLKLRASATSVPSRGMSLHQVLLHCTQSIDYSLTGFPQMKPKLVRVTIGSLVAGRYLSRGRMSHNLDAPVPGAPKLPAEGDLNAAWDGLFAALDRFERHASPVHEHFIFGTLSKQDFGRLHAMHIADHVSAFGSEPPRLRESYPND